MPTACPRRRRHRRRASSDDLGFRVSTHLLRKSLRHRPGLARRHRRRRAAPVHGAPGRRRRLRAHLHPRPPRRRPPRQGRRHPRRQHRQPIGSLITPTTRSIHWGPANPLFARADHVDAILADAGWQVEPGDPDDPLCDAKRVAEELGIYPTTARRWMTDGTIPTVVAPDDNGVPRRYSRLSDVWAHRDQRPADPPSRSRRTARRPLPRDLPPPPPSRPRPRTAPDQPRFTPDRRAGRRPAGRARTRPSTPPPINEAAGRRPTAQAHLQHRRLLAINGELELDPETDTSGARFVTRASVGCWLARNEAKRRIARPVATVPFAEVVRFTGLGRREVVDLVRAGVLEELPGRRTTCEITTTSLEAWLADNGSALSAAIAPTSVSRRRKESGDLVWADHPALRGKEQPFEPAVRWEQRLDLRASLAAGLRAPDRRTVRRTA